MSPSNFLGVNLEMLKNHVSCYVRDLYISLETSSVTLGQKVCVCVCIKNMKKKDVRSHMG